MAGIKISALPVIVTPAATDLFATVQAGVTYRVSGTQLGTLFLPITGGTLTGNLILNGNPTTANQAANKAYVDAVAQGITVQGACRLGSTGALTATYANGASGVGATLTNAGAFAALSLDGVAAAVNDRVLIKNQASTFQNGIYTVTAIGDAVSVNWVLTRATDYDQAAEINPGDLVLITAGTTLTNSGWIETATVVTVGTDPVVFVQFSPSLPVSVPNGGTGLTTTTINQLLYAPSANTLAGLATANSGVLVTSAAGVPSIAVGQIPGTATNDSGNAGSIGEFISSSVTVGAAVALTTTVTANITSIALTAGDWDVVGNVGFIPNAATTTDFVAGGASLVSATLADVATVSFLAWAAGTILSKEATTVIPPLRVSIAAPTTVYLCANATFATNTMSACGGIFARRVR